MLSSYGVKARMKSSTDQSWKTPIIMIDNSSRSSHQLFNPNEWEGKSKQIIISCSSQFILLGHIASNWSNLKRSAKNKCRRRFGEINRQWKTAPWNLDDVTYWVEVPKYHLALHGFLSTSKTLLDLLAQLVSLEKIVNKKMHGFHKKGSVVGGELLDVLNKKTFSTRKSASDKLVKLIQLHKDLWIDDTTRLRDLLVHPKQGVYGIMYRFEVIKKGNEIVLSKVIEPAFNDISISDFTLSILGYIEDYCKSFLDIIHQ